MEEEKALEYTVRALGLNIDLVWLCSTMATIAAINSLLANTMFKALVFLVVCFMSMLVYRWSKGKGEDE